MLSASWCATVRSRYERDTASWGVSIPAAARLISILRRDSGSPLQASAIPPLIRSDEIRFFRPTGDISRNPCAVAPSMAVETIASMLPAAQGAQSIPAARALRMTASTSARSFSGRQLRIAISRRTSVGVSEAATCASAPAAARRTSEFGSKRNRTAAPRASGISASARPTAKALRVSAGME